MQPPFVSPPPPSPQQPCCGSTPGRLFHRPSLSELYPTSTTPRNTPHDLFPDGSSALSPDLDPKFRRSESACRLRRTIGALVGMLEPNITRRQTQPSRRVETPRLRRRRPGPDCRRACMTMEGKASKQVPCVHIPRSFGRGVMSTVVLVFLCCEFIQITFPWGSVVGTITS